MKPSPMDNPFDQGAWDDFPDPPPTQREVEADSVRKRWLVEDRRWTGHAGQFRDAHGYVRDGTVNGSGVGNK